MEPIQIIACADVHRKIDNLIKKNSRAPTIKRVHLGDYQAPTIQGTKGKDKKTGVHFDSIWEFAFYKYHKEVCNHIITRNSDYYFEYTNDTGQKKKFYPDFIVNGGYYEVKGIYRPADICKKNATLGLVTFVDGNDIKPLMAELTKFNPEWRADFVKDTFTFKQKYGKIKAK